MLGMLPGLKKVVQKKEVCKILKMKLENIFFLAATLGKLSSPPPHPRIWKILAEPL
jgi:hypothetical protein